MYNSTENISSANISENLDKNTSHRFNDNINTDRTFNSGLEYYMRVSLFTLLIRVSSLTFIVRANFYESLV